MYSDELPVVTVLIASRDRPQDLSLTLAKLKQQTYTNIELIAIDDASAATLSPVVEQEWLGAVFLRNEINIGQAASRTKGMRLAKGKYILSLDDDSCLTEPEDLRQAVARMEMEPDVGVISFYVQNGLDPVNEALDHLSEGFTRTFCACGALLRKQTTEQVGGYRGFFFCYGEEDEYSLRVLDSGWKILFLPSIVVHHRISPVSRAHGRGWGHSFRNSLWSVLLNMPWYRVFPELLWKLLIGVIEVIRLLQFRWFLWAVSSFISGLPLVLSLRKPVSRDTLVLCDLLRVRPVLTRQECEAPQAPGILETWKWFRSSWWHRRRTRSFWDDRPGGTGKSATAGFSNRPRE